MAIPRSYEKSTIRKIQENREKTKLKQGLLSTDDENLLPNFEVWQHSSSERLDKAYGNQPRYLHGTAQQVAIQASHIKAAHDELALRLGFAVTFEEWFSEWQKGFPSLVNRPGSNPALKTNYPIRDTDDRLGWRTDVGARPEYAEWRHPKANPKYRVIEYFPKGKSEPTNSVLFSGSDSMMISQLINYEWGARDVIADAAPQRETPIVGGHPQVSLHFSARTRLPNHAKPTRLRISWRLMDKVEHSDYKWGGESVLSVTDVAQLTSKIIAKFKDYKVERGDIISSYIFKPLGYSFWHPLRSKAEAVRFYSDVLSIQGHTLREELVKDGSKGVKKSTVPPQRKTILGKEVTIHTAFTLEDLYFRYARLYLPISNQSQTLYIA